MAHFAEINSENIVLRVLVISNEYEKIGQHFCSNVLGLGGIWIQTSFNTRGGIHNLGGTPLRKNYAGIGYRYDREKDAFIPPKQFPSWILNENTCQWGPPVPYPEDGKSYTWNEDSLSWVEFVDKTTQ